MASNYICTSSLYQLQRNTLAQTYSPLHYNQLNENIYEAPSSIYRANETYLEQKIKEKYGKDIFKELSPYDKKDLYTLTKDTLKKYASGSKFNESLIEDLAKIYTLYKSGKIYEQDISEIWENMKTYHYKSSKSLNTPAYTEIKQNIFNNKTYTSVHINDTAYQHLRNEDKLEILLHEYIHILQAHTNSTILNDVALSEGEATHYSNLWLNELHPHISIASPRYQQYAQIYQNYKDLVEKYIPKEKADTLVKPTIYESSYLQPEKVKEDKEIKNSA